jgi:acylphosphatase
VGIVQVNVVVRGVVQDVFCRKWTVESAQTLGLKGWVRNAEDGSVEAVFSGPSGTVDNMIQQCHSGPSAAKVSSVEASKWEKEVPQGFEQR